MKIKFSKITMCAAASLAMASAAFNASAVSPENMDRGRAIAAQVYVRYADDKADYLDGKKPQTVAEIQNLIQQHGSDKDQTLLSQFLNVSIPSESEYSSWDKDRFVQYWSSDFFNNAGGQLDGANFQIRASRIKNRLNTMDVAAPSAAAQPEAPEQPESDELYTPNQQNTTVSDTTKVVEDVTTQEEKKGGSNTWLYVVLLIVLIAFVIWLVAYALRNTKSDKEEQQPRRPQQPRTPDREAASRAYQEPRAYAEPRQTPQTPVYGPRAEAPRADREAEEQRRLLDDARTREARERDRADKLAERVGALEYEIARLKEATLRQQPAQGRRESVSPFEEVVPAAAPGTRAAADASSYSLPDETSAPIPPRGDAARPESSKRVIYLGRANRDKVFVRADKQFTPGKSIYRLVTTNNITGSFIVDTDPSVAQGIAADPAIALYGACEIATTRGAAGFTRVVTDNAGTAIFEDGRWKVMRPAAVHLE